MHALLAELILFDLLLLHRVLASHHCIIRNNLISSALFIIVYWIVANMSCK